MTNVVNRFLFHLVNYDWTSPALDPCMIFLGRINDYGVVWLVLLGALAALGGKTGRWAALAGLTARPRRPAGYSTTPPTAPIIELTQ